MTLAVEPPPVEYREPGYQDDQQPPQDLAAEQAVLGAAMLSVRAADDTAGLLTPDDFYLPKHRDIWSAVMTLRASGDPTDVIAVGGELERRNLFLRCGGAPYLHTLINMVPTAVNAEYYAKRVTSKAVLRRTQAAGHRIVQLTETGARGADTAEIVDLVRREVDAATAVRSQTTVHPVDALVWPWLDGLDDPPAGVVPTPWPALDDVLNGGVRCGELVIVAGAPGSGKTMFATNLVRGAIQDGIRTVVFSLEMSRDDLLARFVADMATVPLTSLIAHEVDAGDRDRVTRAAGRLAEMPLLIDESADLSVTDVRSRCRDAARQGLGLVVVDGLWLMRATDSRVNRQQQIADMSRPLKILAKELNVPVVVLHQLNRNPSTRVVAKPTLNDLRDSGAPAQDADKIVLLWRQEERHHEVTVIVGKHRNGPTGEVVLDWHGRCARISSGDPNRM